MCWKPLENKKSIQATCEYHVATQLQAQLARQVSHLMQLQHRVHWDTIAYMKEQ
jgi:hypothetical protein